jgi:xanthine dehydrogenase FAD-binding subunit
VLGESAISVGGPQVRNIGTIGGNICNGVTSADTASTLLAWDAVLELVSYEGLRYIPISKFYIDAGKVDIRQGELLTSVLISKDSYLDFTGFYYKYSTRNAMDISVCNCSLNVKLSQDKKAIENVRVAYGAAGPVPVRAYSAEQTIKSRLISSELIDEFAEVVINNLNPRSSYRADREFRKYIIREITKKCLTESLRRGGAYGTI